MSQKSGFYKTMKRDADIEKQALDGITRLDTFRWKLYNRRYLFVIDGTIEDIEDLAKECARDDKKVHRFFLINLTLGEKMIVVAGSKNVSLGAK